MEKNQDPADTNVWRYSGEYLDKETGLQCLRARYYDPVAGRFTSEDSVWGLKQKFLNGKEFDDPLSLNLYTYCHNDPIEFVDPSGHIVETVVDIASIGWSAYDMWNNPSWANAGYLAWDIAATLVPIAPGSYVVKAPKATAKALSKANNAKKASKGAGKMDLQLFGSKGTGKVVKVDKNYFKNFDGHYEKHVINQKEFGNISKDEYFARALDLATNKVDGKTIISRSLSNGREAIYNKAKNEIVITHGGQQIGTFFKPSNGIKYFNGLK